MIIKLTTQERKQLNKLVHVGDGRGYRVYDSEHKIILKASIDILCDCGKKLCSHKRLLLLKLLKEYKVR